MNLLKPFLHLASPAGRTGRLSVLIFHRVLPVPDPLFPTETDARRFTEVCGWLKSWFNVLPLDQAVSRLKVGSLPARAACITFDDGYADNFQVAMPILQQHGLPATFFIATGFLDGGRMWNDTIIEAIRSATSPLLDFSLLNLGQHSIGTLAERRAAIGALIDQIKYRPAAERIGVTEQIAQIARVQLPQGLMMTSQQVKLMHQVGMQIGAHTVSHPILAQLADDQAKDEIVKSKAFLEQLLDERVGLFAYPNGKPGEDYSPQTVGIIRSLDFDAAVSTQWGASKHGDDPMQIKRFTPWDGARLRFGVRMLGNLHRG
ncbi:MAG: polysaccharide deacetylase family protein [Burkholderiaceae bacterium]|nr:MAG: polysaccharide deacetylase family protein [Burkholderiaceae bacterium]